MKGAPIGLALALPSNSKPQLERVSKDKCSSLLGLIIINKGKKFYNIDTRCHHYKTLFIRRWWWGITRQSGWPWQGFSGRLPIKWSKRKMLHSGRLWPYTKNIAIFIFSRFSKKCLKNHCTWMIWMIANNIYRTQTRANSVVICIVSRFNKKWPGKNGKYCSWLSMSDITQSSLPFMISQ